MSSKQEEKNVAVSLTGLSISYKQGILLPFGTSHFGNKKKGEYSLEIAKGQQYSVDGSVKNIERSFDRDNDIYIEKVSCAVTGLIVKDVQEPLSQHRGHGTAKPKNHSS